VLRWSAAYHVVMGSDLSRLAALEKGGNEPAASERAEPAEPVPPIAHRAGEPVPDGPVANRRNIRRWGALAALVPPAIAGAVGALLLWGSDTPWRGVPGFGLLVAAVPVLPITGVPAEGGEMRYLIAVIASVVLWLVIGGVAARRATRTPIATWDDWRGEYQRLALGAALGGIGALALSWLVVDLGLV
jgi:hypothetical protein